MISIKKIAICGYYGYRNIGDEAILAAIIESIKNRHNAKITVFSGNPEETITQHGIKAVYIGENIGSLKMFKISNITKICSIIKTISKTDLLIVGGGGIIHDRAIRGVAKFWLNKIILGKLLRKPIMLYAPGVGPIQTKLGKFLAKFALGSVNIITVRDEASKKVLLGCGITKTPIHVTADPVLTLTPAHLKRVEEILVIEGITHTNPLIGMSVRWNPYEFKMDDEFVEQFKKTISEVSDYIIEKLNVDLVFIPMQFPPRETCDIKIMGEIYQMMKHKNRAKIIRGMYSPQEILGIVGEMDMIVGMRLHSLIFAARMNVPMVGIVYDFKVNEFLQMVGQEIWSCDYKNIELLDLFGKIDYVWKNRNEIKTDLRIKVTKLQKKAIYNAELVKTLLEN